MSGDTAHVKHEKPIKKHAEHGVGHGSTIHGGDLLSHRSLAKPAKNQEVLGDHLAVTPVAQEARHPATSRHDGNKTVIAPAEGHKLEPGSKPTVNVQYSDGKTNSAGETKPTFTIKQGKVFDSENHEVALKDLSQRLDFSKGVPKDILIQVDQAPDKDPALGQAQKTALNSLVDQLNAGMRQASPEINNQGIAINDQPQLLADQTKAALSKADVPAAPPAGDQSRPDSAPSSPHMPEMSPETRQAMDRQNRFHSGHAGHMPASEASDYIPNRDKPGANETNNMVAHKDAVAGVFNPDKDHPYQTVRRSSDGSHHVGRYGFSANQLKWLANLSPEELQKLIDEGKIPADFAKQLQDPEFKGQLQDFAKQLEPGGNEEAIKAGMDKFLSSDKQEAIAGALISRMDPHGTDPGKVAQMFYAGHSPDQPLTADEQNSPEMKQVYEAGNRLAQMSRVRQFGGENGTINWDDKGNIIDRSQFDRELQDPRVMAAFAGRMNSEVGTQGEAACVAFAESVMNRAAARGHSLYSELCGS